MRHIPSYVEMLEIRARQDFSPDQPRDANGMWSAGGSVVASGKGTYANKGTLAAAGYRYNGRNQTWEKPIKTEPKDLSAEQKTALIGGAHLMSHDLIFEAVAARAPNAYAGHVSLHNGPKMLAEKLRPQLNAEANARAEKSMAAEGKRSYEAEVSEQKKAYGSFVGGGFKNR